MKTKLTVSVVSLLLFTVSSIFAAITCQVPRCEAQAKSESAMVRHIMRNHTTWDSVRKQYKCMYGHGTRPAYFDRRFALRAHVKAQHSKGQGVTGSSKPIVRQGDMPPWITGKGLYPQVVAYCKVDSIAFGNPGALSKHIYDAHTDRSGSLKRCFYGHPEGQEPAFESDSELAWHIDRDHKDYRAGQPPAPVYPAGPMPQWMTPSPDENLVEVVCIDNKQFPTMEAWKRHVYEEHTDRSGSRKTCKYNHPEGQERGFGLDVTLAWHIDKHRPLAVVVVD